MINVILGAITMIISVGTYLKYRPRKGTDAWMMLLIGLLFGMFSSLVPLVGIFMWMGIACQIVVVGMLLLGINEIRKEG